MDLVLRDSAESEQPRQLSMSPAAKALARITTSPVERKKVIRLVRMVGKVDYNETAVRTISAWVPGRLERLFVDYTGLKVQKGDHLVQLYSPELYSAQEELLATRARMQSVAPDSSDFLTESNQRAYVGARQKLQLLGLTEAQVSELETRGEAEEYVDLTSPQSGVVIEKLLEEGTYVQTGTPIYRVADLSKLWVLLDAYEQDLVWLRYGQDVSLEVEALPGETFAGTVVFIDPIIHEHTRTAKVRVNVDNSDGRLKPGMFVRATVSAPMGSQGVIVGNELAGKWVSPMHPEVIHDEPGQCDVCGMDLVPAESLGLVPTETTGQPWPLVIPLSAVLATGKRAVVYVEVPDTERPTYEGREVQVGPRAGDSILVLSGLAEGERVVTHGAFRIDSSMQIQAKPSMMSMPGDALRPGPGSAAAFRAQLAPWYGAYAKLQQALAGDDLEAAQQAVELASHALEEISATALDDAFRASWTAQQTGLREELRVAASAQSLEGVREAFAGLAKTTLDLVQTFGHNGAALLVEVHCPMAFDNRGADWLQVGEEVSNPYFGASMLRCGEVRGRFPGVLDPGSGELDSNAPTETAETVAPAPSAPTALPGFAPMVEQYLDLQRALAADAEIPARTALANWRNSVMQAVPNATLPPAQASLLESLHQTLMQASKEPGLAPLRVHFGAASQTMLGLLASLGNPLEQPLRVVHCPMAFANAGADWLQSEAEVQNPYFGASMLGCGEILRTLPSTK
ncbi:MAG: efflux RND transporter periplasmic adaptor subunit [Planctomycetes bacterium]|nr:efflux RND transporter periplasmic adaptor subunit [Planctomycetota bacterium]